jgi:polyadenylate-binding protein
VNLYVKNLEDSVTKETLRQEFAHCGNITSTTVMTDDKGNSRGFGFVCFSSPEEATKAVTEMNGTMLNNKPIYVALAQRKEYRKAQLEAQHAQRAQSGMRMPQMGPGGMYPQNPAVFYGGQAGVPGVGQRVMYQQANMARRWGGPGQQGVQGRPGQYVQQPIPSYVGGNVNMGAGRAQGGRGAVSGARGGRGQPKGAGRAGPQTQPGGGRGNFAGQKQRNFQAPVNQNQELSPLPSTAEMAASNPEDTKQLLGERLYLAIMETQSDANISAKVTGMILEYMDIGELLNILEDKELLSSKVNEALTVLRDAEPSEGEEGGPSE